MATQRKAQLEKLCQKIGYVFKDVSLLEMALTHRSVPGKNNERLEFLGDSIVNFLIAETLYQQNAKATEGELSRLRASLVKGDTLAEIAKDLTLGKYLLLGSGELKSGGRERVSILADAMEALIAAIYLDSSMENCRERVLAWFHGRIQEALQVKVSKDFKTQLQEHMQALSRELPVYTVLNIQGQSHEQIFLVQCSVSDFQKETRGTGPTRRRAEQESAKLMLQALGVIQ